MTCEVHRRSRLVRVAKVGGSAWESNPASPRLRGATDFEDREGHRAPFTSDPIVVGECETLKPDCGQEGGLNESARHPQSAMES